ncbi:MAG: DUF465 domain-containing protein [Magnetococcales bacterium]|nr:DUF465 domain-containing protein [Magnetococcales bacterium]
MFEDQLQAVKELLTSNAQFKKLHDRHNALKTEIEEMGRTMDKFKLDRLKKEKLLLKDQMASILAEHTG